MAKKNNQNNNENTENENLTENNDARKSNGLDEVWRFFSSMKLGLALLLIIAAASVVGTLLPVDQNTGLPTYNIYKTFWFQGLLAILCVNLLVCSLNRVKIIRRALGLPNLNVSENYVKKLKNYTSLRKKTELSSMVSSLETALKDKGYRTTKEDKGEYTVIAADKGRFGVTGSFITHMSFIILTIGALIGNITTYEGYVNAVEGDTFSLVNNVDWSTKVKPTAADDFQVKVNKFTMETYPDGSPKGYFSDLTVIDQGKEQFTKVIRVNDPLQYRGVKFYQSSYGSVNKVIVNVLSKGKENSFSLSEQSGMAIPGTDLELRLLKFIPDFDPANPEQSKSDQPNNPAVAYGLYKGGQPVQSNYQLFSQPVVYEGVTFTFTNFESAWYTGLSVRKDPGVPIVWLGCGLMVGGITLSFLLQHRKFWAVVKSVNGIAIADVGAVSDKNRLALEDDFNAIIKAIQD